jgi:F-type H+-transporting ATPase subunit epsilon
MPDAAFLFSVLSPMGTAFSGIARAVTVPTKDGEVTVLARHMPLVAVLTDGEVIIDTGEKEVSIAIAGGFLDTTGAGSSGSDWQATVLSDFATQSDSIETARVEAAKARAEQLLAEKRERGDLQLVERDLQRAILQLKIAERVRTRRRPTPQG